MFSSRRLRSKRRERRRLGIVGRARGFLAISLLLAMSACASPSQVWQESGAATHPLVGQIYRVADGTPVSEANLLDAAAAADFVLIGESHGNRDHHRLQALIVSALQRDRRRPRAVAFEMIAADRQLELVEYLDAHPDDTAGLGPALGWAASGWPEWALYEPIARAALANGGQIVAADLNEQQRRAVFEQGEQALRTSFVQRTGLDRDFPAPLTSDLRAELREAHCGQVPPNVLGGMYHVQRARDAMLADRLAAASGRGGGVLIAGNGHVRTDRGVPWYLARLEPAARTLSIGLLEVREDLRRPPSDLPYDYVWFTPRADRGEDPCAAHEGDLQRLQERR